MKIKKIKINNYGKLENKEINLKNKLNIIYGKNESGKSTLLSFIKNIFYGISKNKNGKDISDYDKFKPWGKEEFSGKLQYELDNGEELEIFRDFNKKKPKIFNSMLEDISNKFNIDKKDGIQFFFEQTGVDETMFTSTVLAMQDGVKLDSQEQSVLIQKLANLAGTGDDNLSYKRLIDRLGKMQIEEIGTERSQGRPINVVKERLKNIEVVLKEKNDYQKDKETTLHTKKELMEKIRKTENELELYRQISTMLLRKQTEEEKVNIKKKYAVEKKIKIDDLKLEKDELTKKLDINNNDKKTYENNLNNYFGKNNEKNIRKNKKEKIKIKEKINYKKYILILLLILIINILTFIFNNNYLKNNILNYFNFLIIPIYLIIIFIYEKTNIKKMKNKIKIENEKKLNEINLQNEKIKYEINILDKQISTLENEINIQEQEIQTEEIKLDNLIEIELQNLKYRNNKLNINEYIESAEKNNINILINEKQEILNKNKMLLQTIKINEENISNKLDEMVNLQEEYEELTERLKELEKRNNEINLTKEFLTKAYINMKNNITPKFTENLSKNISVISNEKYTKVMVNEDKGLIIENTQGDYIPANYLSIGTIEQLYLSLRLSMVDELSKEKMPIILDESFAYYDEERLKNILEFLYNNLEEHQVIIFTCTKREKNVLDKIGLDYNLIEI